MIVRRILQYLTRCHRHPDIRTMSLVKLIKMNYTSSTYKRRIKKDNRKVANIVARKRDAEIDVLAVSKKARLTITLYDHNSMTA